MHDWRGPEAKTKFAETVESSSSQHRLLVLLPRRGQPAPLKEKFERPRKYPPSKMAGQFAVSSVSGEALTRVAVANRGRDVNAGSLTGARPPYPLAKPLANGQIFSGLRIGDAGWAVEWPGRLSDQRRHRPARDAAPAAPDDHTRPSPPDAAYRMTP